MSESSGGCRRDRAVGREIFVLSRDGISRETDPLFCFQQIGGAYKIQGTDVK
jgi:hypothetical protein